MKKSSLLINEPPLQVSPTLAASIGLNEAIVIQQLHYWICNPKCQGEIDPAGNKWIYNTYEEWQEGNFPFWSVQTIQRIFLNLEKSGVVIAAQLNAKRRDMRKHYRIAYDVLDTMDSINLTPSNVSKRDDVKMNQRLPTETTTDIKKDRPDFKNLSIEEYKTIPELKTFIEATGWIPGSFVLEYVYDAVRDGNLTKESISAAFKEWTARNYKAGNVQGYLAWAKDGIPPAFKQKFSQKVNHVVSATQEQIEAALREAQKLVEA